MHAIADAVSQIDTPISIGIISPLACFVDIDPKSYSYESSRISKASIRLLLD